MTFSEFGDMSDEQVITYLLEQGCGYYQREHIRKLPDGEWAIIMDLFFTTAVCLGVSKHHLYKYRWCFENPVEAHLFFNECQNYDDIPTKRDSLKGHRYLTEPLLSI